MNIRIGFLHNRKTVKVKFNGVYSVKDCRDNPKGFTEKDRSYEITLLKSVPAEHQWYEKIDTVFDVGKLESYRQKYDPNEIRTKTVKAGKQIGRYDNFEYWILRTSPDMSGKIYPSGDFKYKKLVKKVSDGEISFSGEAFSKKISFIPESRSCSFTIEGVRVGIDFHWDHKEDLEYGGGLEIMIDNSGGLTAVNIVDLEEYLASVNSSEMRNDNNIEMLKAQTVAARSTVLATMGKHHFDEGFDLCSDDHCQCYQGIGKLSELSVRVAEETKGEVLMFDSRFVDARYSKICGGITERYSACWEDFDLPYLASFYDDRKGEEVTAELSENETREFIDNSGQDCFCNTFRHELPQSLSFCKDLFRWEVSVSSEDIRKNLKDKFGIEIGEVKDITAILRGRSGRIIKLKVTGSEGEVIIDKELNVRRLLSPTHLPSSAFYILKSSDSFILKGAGWGHGVGLCQIGAQIMGESGYNYKQILKHYYRGASVRRTDGL
ncbi:MAG: SpoIID/LytB domain-containing protein [Candidatus Delongbacteria bacterium]|nr:SpoIID/LytB domain-containing protein [Candidatus Delongbacteria bacterium]